MRYNIGYGGDLVPGVEFTVTVKWLLFMAHNTRVRKHVLQVSVRVRLDLIILRILLSVGSVAFLYYSGKLGIPFSAFMSCGM